jgi:hypothetical protein
MAYWLLLTAALSRAMSIDESSLVARSANALTEANDAKSMIHTSIAQVLVFSRLRLEMMLRFASSPLA